MYELWYMISGGSPALKQMTWSDIVSNTGPPIILSYTFLNILKLHTNYSIGIRSHNLYDTSTDSKKSSIEMYATGITIISNILRSGLLHKFQKVAILNNLPKIKRKNLWWPSSFEILQASISGLDIQQHSNHNQRQSSLKKLETSVAVH